MTLLPLTANLTLDRLRSDYGPKGPFRWGIVSLIAALLAILVAVLPGECGDVDLMRHGIDSISNRQYTQAASDFNTVLKSYPNNEQAHYCLAVCLHYMNRYSSAASQYQWVCQHSKEQSLVRRAQKGLDGVNQLLALKPSNPASAQPIGSSAFGTNVWESTLNSKPGTVNAQKVVPQRTGASYPPTRYTTAGRRSASGTPKIVDVYTDWCHFCKRFEPIFEEASSKYAGRIAFERINAEQPENQSFIQQYRQNIDGYPTLMFFDAGGNLVQVQSGAPRSMEIFESRIGTVWPQFKY